jgi:hypothetical protein
VLFRLCTPIGWEGTYAQWIDGARRHRGARARRRGAGSRTTLRRRGSTRDARLSRVRARRVARPLRRGPQRLGRRQAHRPRSVCRLDRAGAAALSGRARVSRVPRPAVRRTDRRHGDVSRDA